MPCTSITAAARLIADIDPPLARAFINQPFNRSALVTAFHVGLSASKTYAHLADAICMALRRAIDASRVAA